MHSNNYLNGLMNTRNNFMKFYLDDFRCKYQKQFDLAKLYLNSLRKTFSFRFSDIYCSFIIVHLNNIIERNFYLDDFSINEILSIT